LALRQSHSPHPPFRSRRHLPFRSKRQTSARVTTSAGAVTKASWDRQTSGLRPLSLNAKWTALGTAGTSGRQAARKTMSRRCLWNRRLPRSSLRADWTGRLAAEIRVALPVPLTRTWEVHPACSWSRAFVLHSRRSRSRRMLPVSLRPLQQLKSRCVPTWAALPNARATRRQHL